MTNSNPHIAARIQEKVDRIKNSHSAFWIGSDVEELTRKVEVGSLDHLDRLRTVQRAVGNFVKIVTGEEIPVLYSSGKSSYTTGKEVVLSADIDPTKLDSMVGVALHEGAHCLLSGQSLEFLQEMHKRFDHMVGGHPIVVHAQRLNIPLTEKNLTPAMGTGGDTVIGHVQLVMNVLEDRRIDLWMYQNAPGYRPYYEEMYNEHWHSKDIDKALQDPKFRETAVRNYFLFVINLTNTNFDENALPGLAKIKQIANLTEKGLAARGNDDPGFRNWKAGLPTNTKPVSDLTKFPKLFADAVEIVTAIYSGSTIVEPPKSDKDDEGGAEDGEGEGENPGDLPNLDGGIPRKVKVSRNAMEKALAKQIQFANGQLTKEEISAEVKAQLDQLEQTSASIVDVEGDFLPRNVKARVIVYRDITKETVKTDAFPFKYNSYYSRAGGTQVNPDMAKALKDGIRLGAILANRIRVMQDERPLTFNRQEHGRLDKRRVAQLGTGARDVFAFTITERRKPANLWMDVDFSGSMNGEKSGKAMTVAVAIAYAAEQTRTLNTTIAVRDGGHDCARVAILYDSRKHQFNKLRHILPYIGVSGGTPESLAFEAIKDEMMQMYKDERKYFINLSDGEPGHGFTYKGKSYSYGGEEAYKHTRRLMNDFRGMGIKVLSYYIGDSRYEHEGFKKMYGQDARFIDPKNIGQIAGTVNKLLMGDDK